MDRRWAYFIGVFLLLAIRVLVLNTDYGEWLHKLHYENASQFILALKNSDIFVGYMGGWALPVFVFAVLLYWMTEEDEGTIGPQFVLLPLVYVPFSIVGSTLLMGDIDLTALYIQPPIILSSIHERNLKSI